MKNSQTVIELRQYTLYPGQRDVLIDLFERQFIETQEAAGIAVAAQFIDMNNADRFVWLRGFGSMTSRKQALTDFYYGPHWQAHRAQANATLYDNDDVLLLRPASPGSGFADDGRARPAIGAATDGGNLIVATIYYFEQQVSVAFIAHFGHALLPLFETSGARVLARYVTEHSPNTFEQLPVRERDHVFVWFAGFADRAAYDAHNAALAQNAQWREHDFAALNDALLRPPETLMLRATARSLVR